MRPQTHLSEIAQGKTLATTQIEMLIAHSLELEQTQEQERREAEGRTGPALFVTDIGKCPAAVWNRLMEIPETQPLSLDSLVNFKVGHAVEEAFAGLLEIQAPDVFTMHREIRLSLPLRDTEVRGRADFLLEGPGTLIELKSISSRSCGFMLKREANGRPEHNSQLNAYLHASQLGRFKVNDKVIEPFDTGLLVYIVKDGTRGEPIVHAFEVPYSREQAILDLVSLEMIWDSFEASRQPICDCKERFNGKGSLYCGWGPQFPCCEAAV